jgi:CHAT domain-containing protein
VIASLWAVEDDAASEWMEHLYRARFQERRTTPESTIEASRAVLAARRARGESTHPFYWGAFVATGEPR